MKINVGSNNKAKVNAVKEIIKNYDLLANAEVVSLKVSSCVSKQPKSLEEITQGAKNRAINSFNKCDYSFGIEAGLTEVPDTKTGYMNECACVIYDGENSHLGLSSLYEYPIDSIRQKLWDNQSYY